MESRSKRKVQCYNEKENRTFPDLVNIVTAVIRLLKARQPSLVECKDSK